MKKTWVLVPLFIIAGCIAVQSCSKSNEVALSQGDGTDSTGTGGGGTGSGCDTANMQYAADVVPILQASCTGCHGNAGGISLSTYANVKKQVDNGALIGSITHASGYVAMPYNRDKLSDCEINKIKAWVARGALNN